MSGGITVGVDLGEARIGIAVADDLGFMAHARKTLEVKNRDAVALLAGELEGMGVARAVVGLPRKLDGGEGPAALAVRSMVDRLSARCPGIDFILWDERLTTAAAQKELHQAGRNTRQSRKVIDQVAAQQILQNYLDAQSLQSGVIPAPGEEP